MDGTEGKKVGLHSGSEPGSGVAILEHPANPLPEYKRLRACDNHRTASDDCASIDNAIRVDTIRLKRIYRQESVSVLNPLRVVPQSRA
jgi:hypothetical protein